MVTNQYGIRQAVKQRHDGTSFPIQNGWHRNDTPSSVSRLKGPSRGDWPEVVAGSADFVPSWDDYASIKNAPQAKKISGSPTATCDSAARLIRALRLRDLLAAVEEWRRASGPDRVWWRRDAQHRLAEWRRLYRIPERAAFQAAVAVSPAHARMHP